VPALRIVLQNGQNVLLDRGSFAKLLDLGKLVSERLNKPLEIEPRLQEQLQNSRLQKRALA
jgi:hypothetical protein